MTLQDRIKLKVILIIVLTGKLILGWNLMRTQGLSNIYFFELIFLFFSAFLCYSIIFGETEFIKFSLTVLICFIMVNSLLMTYIFKKQPIMYFHVVCSAIFLIWNRYIIKYDWLIWVTNIFMGLILIRMIVGYHIYIHSVIAAMLMAIINLSITMSET